MICINYCGHTIIIDNLRSIQGVLATVLAAEGLKKEILAY